MYGWVVVLVRGWDVGHSGWDLNGPSRKRPELTAKATLDGYMASAMHESFGPSRKRKSFLMHRSATISYR